MLVEGCFFLFFFFSPFIFLVVAGENVKEKNYPAQPENVCPQESVCPVELLMSSKGH